jgi:release factor glutamine methyltransferase
MHPISDGKPVITPPASGQEILTWWGVLMEPLELSPVQRTEELRRWINALGLPEYERLAYSLSSEEARKAVVAAWSVWHPLLEKRILQRMPLQYVLGETWFLGKPYYISPPCLIPRPETELLAEAVAEYLNRLDSTRLTIWEVGIGSGCLSLGVQGLLNSSIPLHSYGSDICPHALALAKRNAERVNTPITLFEGSLLEAYPTALPTPDCILANLPYINPALADTLAPEVRDHEAHHALFAEEEGFALIHQLLKHITQRWGTSWKGVLALEFGEGMEAKLNQLLKKEGFHPVQWVTDYGGIVRHVLCQPTKGIV